MVYVKDFIHPESMTDEQLKHLCVLAHHVYGSIDLAGRCIEQLVKRGVVPSNGLQVYVNRLNAVDPF